jgi:phosphoglycolate phosphatase
MNAHRNCPLRLIIFDVDGTLVDSQVAIVASMTAAFMAEGLVVPERARILSIVGLSLDHAMRELAPDAPSHDALVEGYKQGFQAQRLRDGSIKGAPLYPGALQTLRNLAGQPDILLGVATGKSKRGLDALLAAHGLEQMFVTRQVADFHPSKPHPSMIETAMAETGVERAQTVMIGDTSFDMDMAKAAGVAGVGVSWGYHDRTALGSAATIIDSFGDLVPALEQIWDVPA